jgi:hypothetical protein
VRCSLSGDVALEGKGGGPMGARVAGRLVLLTCVFCLVFLCGAGPALGLPPGWRVTQITDNTFRNDSLWVDGSNVAYSTIQPAATSNKLSIYSAGTGTTRILAPAVTQATPVVSGTRVAYATGLLDNREIFVWDAVTGNTRRVTNNSMQDTAPALWGNLLAWQRWDGSDGEICWIDLSSGTEQHFANNFVDDRGPVVRDSWIAYLQEDPAGEAGEVFVRLYNVQTAVNTLVTPSSDPAENLRLDDDLLAFVTKPNYPAHQVSQVMLYDPATAVLQAVTTSLDDHTEMEMDGGRIAYVEERSGGAGSSVVVHEIETGADRSLSSSTMRTRWPDLSSRWVVWQDWDGHDWEIVGCHLDTQVFVRLTNNSVNDDYPRMDSSRVAWTSWKTDSTSDIYLASFALPFTDIPANHVYRRAIENLFILEVMSGYSATTFGLDDALLRQQFAKMIVLATGTDCSEADVCRFVDVEGSGPGELYPDNYVEAAARAGLTKGRTATLFAPGDHVSRAQVMTMIVRAGDRFVAGGLDDPRAGWHGYLSGYSDPTHGQNARIAEYNGLLTGIHLDGWDPDENASRGEVAQMLWNLWDLIHEG